MNKKLEIEVSLKDNPEKENSDVKAFGSITISGVTITGVRIVERNSTYSTGLGYRLPINVRELEDGSKEYNRYAEIKCVNEKADKIVKEEIQKVIQEAYDSKPGEDGYKRAKITSKIDANMEQIKVYAHEYQGDHNSNLRAFATAYIGGIIKLNCLKLTEGINSETEEYFCAINFPQRKDSEGNYHAITFATKDIRENIKMATLIDLEKQVQEESKTKDAVEEEDLAI